MGYVVIMTTLLVLCFIVFFQSGDSFTQLQGADSLSLCVYRAPIAAISVWHCCILSFRKRFFRSSTGCTTDVLYLSLGKVCGFSVAGLGSCVSHVSLSLQRCLAAGFSAHPAPLSRRTRLFHLTPS